MRDTVTVTPTGSPTYEARPEPPDRRWPLVVALICAGIAGSAAVILWPLYGTAAAVLVTVVVGIVGILRN